MKGKRIISSFLTAAMLLQSCVFAVSAEKNTISEDFVYDGYSVNYTVTNSYGNTDVVDITLTNTSEESIENWMLYFNPNGDVQYVNGAAEITLDDGTIYYKNGGYNADIDSNASVSFSYAVNDCENTPDFFMLCQTRVENKDGCIVSHQVNQTWGDNDEYFNGEIVIQNNTDESIEAWELMIDTNFTITEITNSWAATVTELGQYQYKLKGTYTSTIDANSSVTLGFIGTKIGNPEISNHSLTEVKADPSKMTKPSTGSDETIKLSASTKELLTTEDNQVFFYAKPNYKNVTSIELIDFKTNTVLATMYDDGNFGNHGDDLENDGIYSCMVSVDNISEGTLQFIATNDSITSNTVEIVVYEDISDVSIAEMMSANEKLNELKNSDGYIKATTETKQIMFLELMQELSTSGTNDYPYSLVDYSSIEFDSNIYSFEYSCGLIGYFELENPAIKYVDEMLPLSFNKSSLSKYENQSTLLSKSNFSYLGNGHIVFEFDPDTDTHRCFKYSTFEEYADTWTSMGMNTDVYSDVYIDSSVYDNSLEDMKHLQKYDYIVIAGHGAVRGNGHITIKTRVVNDQNSYNRYKKDILSKRIWAFSDFFRVSNKFFEFYYDEDDLEGKVFYLYSCSNFGKNDTIDYSFYDSLHSVGAETVVGYCNDLWTPYSDFMIRTFTESMLHGYTAGDAMEIAKKQHTPTHGEIPVVAGNVNKQFANSNIKNGDFESHDLAPKYWTYSGDVRILSQLGNYIHNKNNFLFMSTGIGAQSEYECSQVNQVFQIPAGATTLTLSYNVISEEPMEWVGDEYDDEFTVNIYSGTNYTNVIRESTNQSTWYRTDIINFYGGDNTMYETQWKTVSIDVSQYAGTVIQLEFNMNNIGDNMYDSAVMIDNVKVA